ncbi:MAG TPA: hypothetical protein PKC18_04690 [Lacipirellulaceae bacterium]|nr:hypothetical protein [Lacipirellulaceae bacterium]
MRKDIAAQAKRPDQHHIEELVQRFIIGFIERLGAAQTGVVDQTIDAAEFFQRRGHDLLRRLRVGHIRRNGQNLRRIGDFRLQRCKLVLAATNTDNRETLLREQLRRGKADTAARARDDGYLHVDRPSFAIAFRSPR